MDIGVSTACFYPMITEKSLKTLLDLGFKNFEFFVNSTSEMEKPFINELKNMLIANDARIISIHPFTCIMEPFLFFGDYERRFADGVEFYKRYFETANFFDAKNIVFHGQVGMSKAFLISDEEYFERYHTLYKEAKSFGLNFSQENVRNCRSGKIDFIKRMKAYLNDEVAFTYDIKQCKIENQDPFEMISTMGEKICQVHISDATENSACLLPGDGERDFSEIIKKLESVNYDKTITIEVYSTCIGENNDFLKSKKLLENLIK